MNGRPRILVVDDEPNLCRILAARLGKDGYDADVVHDGSEALAQLTAGTYDLVLLDLRMPLLGGLETLPAIRERYPATAVMVMTAYDSPEVLRAVVAAGADACVSKPFDLECMLADVRLVLARRAGPAAPAPFLVRSGCPDDTGYPLTCDGKPPGC